MIWYSLFSCCCHWTWLQYQLPDPTGAPAPANASSLPCRCGLCRHCHRARLQGVCLVLASSVQVANSPGARNFNSQVVNQNSQLRIVNCYWLRTPYVELHLCQPAIPTIFSSTSTSTSTAQLRLGHSSFVCNKCQSNNNLLEKYLVLWHPRDVEHWKVWWKYFT